MNYNDNFNPYADTYSVPQNMAATAENPQSPNNKKNKKKKSGFKKVAGLTAGALLLGAVAGGACYGVTYAGYKIFPMEEKVVEINNNGGSEGSTVKQEIVKKEINATVLDASEIVESVIKSVVAVNGSVLSESVFGTTQSSVSGSGFVIRETDTELLIATNAHVIEDVTNTTVTFYDGSKVNATVKGKKTNPDVAVILVKKSDIPKEAEYTVAEIGNSDEIKVGEAAIAIGNSLGYGISVTTGCISALDKTITISGVEYRNLIQTDAAINFGNSGGPLFNAQGQVIGINSAKTVRTGSEGMGYAISISSIKELLEDLSDKNQYSDEERGYLGITGVTITESISEQYGYPVGVLVRTIADNSSFIEAGIVKNDIITYLDDKQILSYDELRDEMKYYKPGDEVTLKYMHLNDKGDYEERTAKVTLVAK